MSRDYTRPDFPVNRRMCVRPVDNSSLFIPPGFPFIYFGVVAGEKHLWDSVFLVLSHTVHSLYAYSYSRELEYSLAIISLYASSILVFCKTLECMAGIPENHIKVRRRQMLSCRRGAIFMCTFICNAPTTLGAISQRCKNSHPSPVLHVQHYPTFQWSFQD